MTGEVSERTTHAAREQGLHFYAAGHHATERYGVLALAEHLAERFDLVVACGTLALRVPDHDAREVIADDTLRQIAHELAERIKAKATLDWTRRDTVRADMRRTVRRLLAKYGYPPDAQEAATQLVIRQAELMAENEVQ